MNVGLQTASLPTIRKRWILSGAYLFMFLLWITFPCMVLWVASFPGTSPAMRVIFITTSLIFFSVPVMIASVMVRRKLKTGKWLIPAGQRRLTPSDPHRWIYRIPKSVGWITDIFSPIFFLTLAFQHLRQWWYGHEGAPSATFWLALSLYWILWAAFSWRRRLASRGQPPVEKVVKG